MGCGIPYRFAVVAIVPPLPAEFLHPLECMASSIPIVMLYAFLSTIPRGILADYLKQYESTKQGNQKKECVHFSSPRFSHLSYRDT
jgi:hypothetical protein